MVDANPNPMRGELLARLVPDPDKLAHYREEVRTMLNERERALKREKWYAGTLWIFVVLLATAFLTLGAVRDESSSKLWAIATIFVLIIGAAVEMGKYFLNRMRMDLLKELKSLELLVREMKEAQKT
jgi:hypothetical protein